jgi:hypothetical protein
LKTIRPAGDFARFWRAAHLSSALGSGGKLVSRTSGKAGEEAK